MLNAIQYGKGCFKYLIKANLALSLDPQLYNISKLRGSSRVKRGGRLSEANPLEKGLTWSPCGGTIKINDLGISYPNL